ncbi:MAG: glycosyltransferase [Patescibacteria group bacterium]|jgi:glycosyltransferase involved in cell wall biosynthesis
MPAENKKRILIFSLAYHPFVGGAEVAIKEITERLGEDFEFDMITANLSGHEPKEVENFNGLNKVYRLGSGKLDKYRFPWLAYRKALELQRQNDYDLIWAMMANQAGWAAWKFKRRFPQIPYLLTLQEGDSERDIWLRTWFIRPLYKAIYRRADRIQAISNFLARRAKRLGAKCPIEVVPNGVDQLKINNEELRNKSNSIKRVISVSRLVNKNGLEDLIKAIAIVNKDNDKPVILKIIGEGRLRNELEKLIKKLKINDRPVVKELDKEEIVLAGQVSNKQVYQYLSQADVFVRPSLSEGLGNAFLEAMAAGVPVIGTPVGGIPDFLKGEEAGDGQTGWFCEVKNPESIAKKIRLIFDPQNQELVKVVTTRAKKLVEEEYDWDAITSKIDKIFTQLL